MKSKIILAMVLVSIMTVRTSYSFQAKVINDTVGINETFRKSNTSPDEKWLAYHVNYGEMTDTLFLQSLETGRQWSFSTNVHPIFDARSRWAMVRSPGRFGKLINLNSGNIFSIPESSKAVFWNDNQSLVLWQAVEEQLILINLDSMEKTFFKGVKQLWDGPGEDILVVEREGGLYLFEGEDPESWKLLVQGRTLKFLNPVWSEEGRFLLFYSQGLEKTILYHFNIQTHILATLDIEKHGLLLALNTPRNIGQPLSTTEDGNWVFVPIKDKVPMEDNSICERWRSDTSFLYPKELSYKQRPLIVAWNPNSNQFQMVLKNHKGKMLPVRNTHKVLVYDEDLYNSDYLNIPKTDLRLLDLNSGLEKVILEKIEYGFDFLSISPDSKSIVFFKNKDWWLYDIVKEEYINITREIPTTWGGINRFGIDTIPYGRPAWLQEENVIVLQDEFDLWFIQLNKLSYERMTYGREKGVTFEVDHFAYKDLGSFRKFHGRDFRLKDGLLLKMWMMNQDRGYAVIGPKGLKKFIPEKPVYYERMIKTSKGYIWVQEAFNDPPELWHQRAGNNKPILIKKLYSYSPIENYGSNQLISYKNANDEEMQGILYYPMGFDPNLQYPMLLHIYEKQSSLLNRFVNPGYRYNNIGWNIANLLKKGYLVFLPDIEYQLGSPGPSALDSVESGVREVIAMGIVKIGSIGLYGHSFGAYEAAYILTHSNLFATGVLGSGVFDIIGHYLNYNEAYGQKPDLWRFENQQYRMNGGLYEDFQNYLNNSPMYHLPKLKVPVLIWAGKQDPNVNWDQSLDLHIALRKLEKPHEFLVFPKQDHVLLDFETRELLTLEMEDWWDRQLK